MSAFLPFVIQLASINRWQLMYCHQVENDAAHSHQVSVIGHLLGLISVNICGKADVSPERVALFSIYHEVSEAVTGDVSSPVKYANKELTAAFKALEAEAERIIIKELPDELRDEVAGFITGDACSPYEKRLMKAADTLSAFIKMGRELDLGNVDFNTVRTNLTPVIVRLRNEMPEVDYFCKTFLPALNLSLDELMAEAAKA